MLVNTIAKIITCKKKISENVTTLTGIELLLYAVLIEVKKRSIQSFCQQLSKSEVGKLCLTIIHSCQDGFEF